MEDSAFRPVLARLAPDVAAAARSRGHRGTVREWPSERLGDAVVSRLADRGLARRIASEIGARSAQFAQYLSPLVRETPVCPQFSLGRKRVSRSRQDVYVLGPLEAPERWLALGRIEREFAMDSNGVDEMHYIVFSSLFWDRDQDDPENLMSVLLAEELGSACATEAIALATRAHKACLGLEPRVGSIDAATAWFNVRATRAFVRQFASLIEEDTRSGGRCGAPVFLSGITTPWGWD